MRDKIDDKNDRQDRARRGPPVSGALRIADEGA
jgi:hypothetical protein